MDETTEVKRPPSPGFWLVARREIRFFRRDHAGWFLVVAIPLIAFAVLAWTFGSAVVRGLNVMVVDMDRSAVSTGVIQQIAAAPGLRITARGDSLTAATKAIRSGDAIAAVYIPPDFEHDLVAGRRPQIVAFYNTQYFTPGNIASKGLRDAITAAAARLSPLREVQVQPVGRGMLDIEEYVLTNPATNYAAFLLRAVMPTVLHVVIAIAAGYAVGTEFSRRSRRAWLRCAGGSPLVALAGKLWPLFAVFFVLLAIDALILHAGFELPYRGNILMIAVAAALFIAAYQALATVVQLLVRELALGLSLTAIITSPAFGYAGVGLPVLAMGAFPQAWGALLPLRWYQQILFDQAARGSPVHASAVPFAILAGMALGLFALAWLCLRRSLPPRKEEDAASPSHRLEHVLHKPVAFVILPIFALANTGIVIGTDWAYNLTSANSIGIIGGLVIGKPVGITLLSCVAVAVGMCRLPLDLHWGHIFGAGLLGGIGFTMSIFMTNLAFVSNLDMINASKMAILLASLTAGILGFLWGKLFGKP